MCVEQINLIIFCFLVSKIGSDRPFPPFTSDHVVYHITARMSRVAAVGCCACNLLIRSNYAACERSDISGSILSVYIACSANWQPSQVLFSF